MRIAEGAGTIDLKGVDTEASRLGSKVCVDIWQLQMLSFFVYAFDSVNLFDRDCEALFPHSCMVSTLLNRWSTWRKLRWCSGRTLTALRVF